MTVEMTRILKAKLGSEAKANKLLADFATWKASDEYGSFFFGKDAYYFKPLIDGEMMLRHVHLVPLTDMKALRRWKRDHKYQSRKTSDRVLIYVSNRKGSYLLLFILDEPHAHEVARMGNPHDRELMLGMCETAAAWLETGDILA